jgi:hypothetical protein
MHSGARDSAGTCGRFKPFVRCCCIVRTDPSYTLLYAGMRLLADATLATCLWRHTQLHAFDSIEAVLCLFVRGWRLKDQSSMYLLCSLSTETGYQHSEL